MLFFTVLRHLCSQVVEIKRITEEKRGGRSSGQRAVEAGDAVLGSLQFMFLVSN